MMARDSFIVGILAFCTGGNILAALMSEHGATSALLAFAAGLTLAWEIRRFLNDERDSALRFQRLVTESGGSLDPTDFPALHAALKRHGVGLA